MDPELARIRRERYLAHRKKNNDANDENNENDTNRNSSRTQNDEKRKDELEIIEINDNDENDDYRYQRSSSQVRKSQELRQREVICLDGDDENDDDYNNESPGKPTLASQNRIHVEQLESVNKKQRRDSTPPLYKCSLSPTKFLHDPHPQTENTNRWIWVRNPTKRNTNTNTDTSNEDIEGLTREFEVASETNPTQITKKMALDLSKKYNALVGKWLIYENKSPTTTWETIRNAVLDNKLGPTAKISPTPDVKSGSYLICIYCSDFTDRKEVLRVRQSLRDILHNGEETLYFKPDSFTYMNVYSGNRFKIRPTIYQCGGMNDKECLKLVNIG